MRYGLWVCKALFTLQVMRCGNRVNRAYVQLCAYVRKCVLWCKLPVLFDSNRGGFPLGSGGIFVTLC